MGVPHQIFFLCRSGGLHKVAHPCFNPNLPTGVMGRVQNKPPPLEGRVEKKLCAACPQGPGLEPGTYCVLGESPQLHAKEVV